MELSDLWAALKRWWWVPVVCAVVAAAAALVLVDDDTVRSSGVLVVGADPTLVGEGARFSAADEVDSELINTFADLAEGDQVVAAAAEDAEVDPDGLTVIATPGQDAKTLRVAVEGDDAAAVEAMTPAVMTAATDRLLSLYDIFQVQVVDEPGSAVTTAPSKASTAGVALVLGLGLGVALVLTGAVVARWRGDPAPADDPS